MRRLLVTLLVAMFSQVAQAQPPSVSLQTNGCPDIGWRQVERLIGIELRAVLLTGDGVSSDTTRVVVDCTQPVLTLRVLDPITGKKLSRRIAIDNVLPAARARLLALAIVELVAASWIEMQANREPAIKSPDQTASDNTREQAKIFARSYLRAAARWRLAVLGGGRAFHDPTHFSWGASATVERSVSDWLALSLDVAATRVDVAIDGGRAEMTTVSVAGVVLTSRDAGPLLLQAGVGGRVGGARIVGRPRAGRDTIGQTISGPWAGPLVDARVSWPRKGVVALVLRAEAGWALLSVRGLQGGQSSVSADNVWTALWLGVQLSL